METQNLYPFFFYSTNSRPLSVAKQMAQRLTKKCEELDITYHQVTQGNKIIIYIHQWDVDKLLQNF